MDFNSNNMQYPLKERLCNPRLMVERKAEFKRYHQWIAGIPEETSKSLAILARKKSGKTAFVQRLYNQVWSANGPVIPFYMEIPAAKIWLPNLAHKYYRTFANHYISFLQRDPLLVRTPLSLEQIREYGQTHGVQTLVDDVDGLFGMDKASSQELLWEIAWPPTASHQPTSNVFW